MKRFISIAWFFLSFTAGSYSQQKDVLIQLSPSIGDILNLQERNYYGMYPEFVGFKNSVFYTRSDKSLIIKIEYQNNLGENKDTVIIENISSLGKIRAYVRRIDKDRTENFQDARIITLMTKDAESFKGKLLDVKLNLLFMVDDFKNIDNTYLINNYKIFNKEKIYSVSIKGKGSKAAKGLVLGILIGGGIGGLVGSLSAKSSQFRGLITLLYAIPAGVVGAIVGLIVGSKTITPDELIIIKTDEDFKRLNNYL